LAKPLAELDSSEAEREAEKGTDVMRKQGKHVHRTHKRERKRDSKPGADAIFI
jgi:hypothetical protein